ncbi:MAG TPA: DoxX family protein [Anaeromyxobacter sp.]|nr:DoxX family protein [Anaeromyxobacter sp.]
MADTAAGRKTLWVGRVVSALPILMMLLSGVLKLAGGPQMAKDWASFGYPPSTLVPIGVTEIACAILYLIPRTSVLGAVLVTGYLGGAVATHVRVSQLVFPAPALLGVLAWLGLFLRDPRLRALLPLRREP